MLPNYLRTIRDAFQRLDVHASCNNPGGFVVKSTKDPHVVIIADDLDAHEFYAPVAAECLHNLDNPKTIWQSLQPCRIGR